MCLHGLQLQASASHRASELAYARAEKLQGRLNARPSSARTRRDYERVLDAYRAVYHGDPGSPDAGRSIAAVADLLASEGRCFHDARLSRDAVAQWKFLRREYPGSPLRRRALLEETQIEQQDLRDRAAARKPDRSYGTHTPHDAQTGPARAELNGQPDRRSRGVARSIVKTAAGPNLTQPFAPVQDAEPPAAKTLSEKKLPVAQQGHAASATIQAIRYWGEGAATRVAVDLSAAAPYRAYIAPGGDQITLIFFGARLADSLAGHAVSVAQDGNLHLIRTHALTADQSELVLTLSRAAQFSSFSLTNPDRVVLNIQPVRRPSPAQSVARADVTNPDMGGEKSAAKTRAQHGVRGEAMQALHKPSPADALRKPSGSGTPEALQQAASSFDPAPLDTPLADGQGSMSRVLGLRVRRIVIDAGHGGHDSGTLGPDGLEEKDVALDVALRLGHLLHERLDADVIYTRSTDRYVPLEERTAIANRAQADLFISIHANSSSDPEVRGVETYFLNFTASPDALKVAARENETSNRSVHELSDLVRKITLSDKIDESRAFAGDVQQSLYSGLAGGNAGLKDRGVRQAPFAVLIGAHMPSILAEVSFLTNTEDASELAHPAYRQRVAYALYRGVAAYVNGMSGVRLAKTAQDEAISAPVE